MADIGIKTYTDYYIYGMLDGGNACGLRDDRVAVPYAGDKPIKMYLRTAIDSEVVENIIEGKEYILCAHGERYWTKIGNAFGLTKSKENPVKCKFVLKDEKKLLVDVASGYYIKMNDKFIRAYNNHPDELIFS